MQRTETQVAEEPQTAPNLPNMNLEQVIGYGLLDKNSNEIGKVSAFWTDHTGRPAFIGVKTFWLMGKAHVIPAYGAEVNHGRKSIRVPFTNETVKDAPNYDPDAELAPEQEREVIGYYQSKGQGTTYQGRSEPGYSEEARTERVATERVGTEHAGTEHAGTEHAGTEETRMPLYEEELAVGKRAVEAGGVRLRKVIRTETVQQPVEVKREDVVVERVPASEGSHPQPAGEVFESKEVYIPLWREEPVVSKEARLKEEVLVRKTEERESQTISGEIRKEEVEVEDQRKEPRR